MGERDRRKKKQIQRQRFAFTGAVGDQPSFLLWTIERRSIKSRDKMRKADVIIWFSLLWYCYF